MRKSEFEDSPELDSMVHYLLDTIPEEFPDCFNFKFKVFYTSIDPSERHFAGLCRKLDKAVKFRTGLDYIILIWKPAFDEYLNGKERKVDEAFTILIHELHHIMGVRNQKKELIPRLRKHNEEEDFCELPSHDEYSVGVWERLKAKVKIQNESLKQPDVKTQLGTETQTAVQ